jgi:hypothetical protein
MPKKRTKMLPKIISSLKPASVAIWLVAVLFLVYLGCATSCPFMGDPNTQYIVILPDNSSTSVTTDASGNTSVSISSGNCADIKWIRQGS